MPACRCEPTYRYFQIIINKIREKNWKESNQDRQILLPVLFSALIKDSVLPEIHWHY